MPTDVVPILIAISLLVGFVVAARAWLLWQSIADTRADVRRWTARLGGGPARARETLMAFRGNLGEASADVERALWSLARFDERSARVEGALRVRRTWFDEIRVRYLGSARRGMARARQAIRLLKQVIELRRTFLG